MQPEKLNVVVDGERYRTALSFLLADDGKETFLFRALNSNYFVQRQGDRSSIDVLPQAQAQEMYHRLPNKHQDLVAAFPKGNGGIGMDTTSSYDDDDEKERLTQMAGG
jgi:FixJ family two-component response regulator